MHGDEGELEAAGEEAEHQQHIGAMAEGFRERRLERLLVGDGHVRRRRRRRRERQRQRHDQQHQQRKYRQRRLPAEIVDHRHAERREQELAERAGRGAGAERDAALLRRQQFAERRQHQIERTAGQAEADQHAGAEIERHRRRRIAHQQQAAGIEQRADHHHAQHAETVGDRARDRLAQSPQQVLQRQRQAEHVAAPGEFAAHRLDEETEARARPETQQRDRAAADDDDQRRPPAAEAGRGSSAVTAMRFLDAWRPAGSIGHATRS